MIGDVHIRGDRVYLESNRHGTYERLPKINGWRQLQLYAFSRFIRRWTINDTRSFCIRHAKGAHR